MTQEEINARLESKTSELDRRIDLIMSKVDNVIEELRDFKNEMRQQNEMRAAENRDMQTRFDEKFDKFMSQTQTLTVAALGAIGAMVLTVMYSVFTR